MPEYTIGSNVSVSIFLYEPFSYRWTYPGANSFTFTTSTFLSGSITKDVSGVTFASSGYFSTSTGETLVVRAFDAGSNLLAVSSNSVTVDYGRFVDDTSSSLTGRRFTFYRSEPIAPTVFSAAFALAGAPIPAPSLPFGLGFVSNSPTRYTLQGTPVLQTPVGLYTITGSNVGVTQTASAKQVSIAVNAERMILDLSGNGLVSLMQVGTPISPQSLYARCPPYPRVGANLSNIQYSWTPLPGGLSFTDVNGVPQTSPFTPADASATLILQGTPTLAGAKEFASLNISQASVGVTARRIGSTSVVASQEFITSFGETVLFNDIPAFKFYKDVSLNPTANFVEAKTWFAPTDVSITSITAPFGLPPGLTLTFDASQARAYLQGTPTTIGTGTYTFRASNANARTQDTAAAIEVVADAVTITGPVDVCYNFILSRPAATAFTGYYPSPIAWTATAASSQAVTFSAPALTGTGLSLSVSGNTATLSGIPDTVTSLRNLRVTATSGLTGATASRDVSFAVLPDVFTFGNIPLSNLSFIQNKAITPVQVTATTLSERSIVSYVSSNLPSGLALSTGGLLTGTPLTDVSGSFTVVASTGYASGSQSYSYAITPDVLLFQVDPVVYTYSPGAAVSIDLNGTAYSGTSVSNYTFSNFTPSYGLSIGATTGIISGNLIDGLPPGLLLPVSCNFTVNATAGSLDASLSATMVTTNPVVYRNFLLVQFNNSFGTDGTMEGLYITDDDTLSNWTLAPGLSPSNYTDFRKKNTTVDSNTYLVCGAQTVYRSTDGRTFTPISFGDLVTYANPYTAWNVSNSSNWFIAGTEITQSFGSVVFVWTSADDGQTWTRKATGNERLAPRTSQLIQNYYTTNGVAFASNSGVLLLGGGDSTSIGGTSSMLRSTDEGTTWARVTTALSVEVATFNTDASRWIAAGSSLYTVGNPGTPPYFMSDARTMQYSDDLGDTWTDTTGAYPTVATYTVAYASNTWLAAGLSRVNDSNIVTQVACSSDGRDWSNVTLPETFTQYEFEFPLPETGPIWSDGSNWNLMVKRNKPPSSDPAEYDCKIYTHSLTGDLTTGWTLDASGIFPLSQGKNYMSRYEENYVRTGTPTTVTFTFNAIPPGGPVITSPTSTSLLFYQYVRFTPIQITATGTGTIYYFLDTAELPDGITFDPLTATLSGKSVVLGTKSFNVYAKDDVGVTKIVFQTTTILPTMFKIQSNASAYTSYLRQYTVVNAARTAENNVAYPSEITTIGEFTRPTPPSETTATVDPKCYSTSNCT